MFLKYYLKENYLLKYWLFYSLRVPKLPLKYPDEKWNFYPNVCLTMKHRIIFLTKSDLNNYTGKHEYHKNHRKEKYDIVIG